MQERWSAMEKWATDWSPDGNNIVFTRNDPETGHDLWYLRRTEDGEGYEEFLYLQTEFHEIDAQFSPDGRFVVYSSNDSGRYEIYVKPFPEGDSRWQLSLVGGTQPRWSQDGNEVFYVLGDTLCSVPIATAPVMSIGLPTKLFQSASIVAEMFVRYDVSPDGKRFVISEPVGEERSPVIRVVQNWYEEFRDWQ